MKKQTLYEQIAKGLADAITDIREKVVEEPWYGRVVTDDRGATPHWPEPQEIEPGLLGSHLHEREVGDIDR